MERSINMKSTESCIVEADEMFVLREASNHFEKHGPDYIKAWLVGALQNPSECMKSAGDNFPADIVDVAWLHSKAWAEKLLEINKEYQALLNKSGDKQ